MKLSLPEQLLLLALDDEKGNTVASTGTSLHYAIAGSVMFELLKKKIFDQSGNLFTVKHGVRTGDEALDVVLEMSEHLSKPRSMSHLIQLFSGKAERIKSIVLERLVRKGILAKEEHRFLWVIHYDRYPSHDLVPENEIRKRMIDVIQERVSMEESDLVLLSLIGACDLEKEVFPKEIVKETKSRIKVISRGEEIGSAVSEITKQVEVAVTAAITAATIAAIT